MRIFSKIIWIAGPFILITACVSEPTSKSSPVKAVEPSWHWEWASTRPGGTSEQFGRDRYACRQDYNPAAAPPFVHRYPDLELQWMSQHEDLCLEGKGWKKVQNTPAQPTKEPKEQRSSGGITAPMVTTKRDQNPYYWRPSGWYESPSGTKPIWFLKGHPVQEPDAQKKQDSDECNREAGISDTKSVPTNLIEKWFACMWSKGWSREPVAETTVSLKPQDSLAQPSNRKQLRFEWVWRGSPEEEVAAVERFELDRDECLRKFGIGDAHKASSEQLETVMGCMSSKKWAAEPTSTP